MSTVKTLGYAPILALSSDLHARIEEEAPGTIQQLHQIGVVRESGGRWDNFLMRMVNENDAVLVSNSSFRGSSPALGINNAERRKFAVADGKFIVRLENRKIGILAGFA